LEFSLCPKACEASPSFCHCLPTDGSNEALFQV
jgi:hypothetical protein